MGQLGACENTTETHQYEAIYPDAENLYERGLGLKRKVRYSLETGEPVNQREKGLNAISDAPYALQRRNGQLGKRKEAHKSSLLLPAIELVLAGERHSLEEAAVRVGGTASNVARSQ